jgi:hypothetical protein
MDLKAIATKPQLQKFTLESKFVMDTYGEPLEFYMWDRQSMPTFIRLSSIDKSDFAAMIECVRDLVLDSKGNQMLERGDELPVNVMLDLINSVVDHLGNSVGQISAA